MGDEWRDMEKVGQPITTTMTLLTVFKHQRAVIALSGYFKDKRFVKVMAAVCDHAMATRASCAVLDELRFADQTIKRMMEDDIELFIELSPSSMEVWSTAPIITD